MKIFKIFLTVILLTGLTSCRSTGYNERSLDNSMTSSTSQSEYVRTYDANGNPIVKPVTPPSTTDPASPDYRGSH